MPSWSNPPDRQQNLPTNRDGPRQRSQFIDTVLGLLHHSVVYTSIPDRPNRARQAACTSGAPVADFTWNGRSPNKQSPVPLYYQLAEMIEARIVAGNLQPGDR